MNKLIPLSEYVLEEKRKMIETFEEPGTTSDDLRAYKNFISKVTSYTEFLRQPWTLGMFVPVDENGNLVSEPKYEFNWGYLDELKVYNEAKERVLFEGFYQESAHTVFNDELKVRIFLDTYQFMVEDSLGYGGGNLNGETLEDLANADLKLPLTPSALKIIGKE